MTRLYRPALPIEVRLAVDGAPAAVYCRNAWHDVDQIANHWRVRATWWSAPENRDYWKLATPGGLLITIYQDLDSGEWRLERLYD